MRILLLVDSFDLRPSNQRIFVRVIPNCLRFVKMCLCQVSLLSRCSPRYLTSSALGELNLVYVQWGTHFSTCGECDVSGIRFIGFSSPFYEPILYC
jgi:hypothetical protein